MISTLSDTKKSCIENTNLDIFDCAIYSITASYHKCYVFPIKSYKNKIYDNDKVVYCYN